MSTEHDAEAKKESTGIALAGMILSTVGLAGVFLPAWKSFALICASVGLIVSIYSFYKTKKAGAKKGRAVAGILLGVLTLYIAVMMVVLKRVDAPSEPAAIPAELVDSTAIEADEQEALEKLNAITDTSQSQ